MSETVECPECGAANGVDESFCESCGVKLVKKAAAAPPPVPAAPPGDAAPPPLPAGRAARARPKAMSRRARREADPEAVERSRQRQEFGRIKSIVFTVRAVYRAGVVFAVVQLLLYHLILAPLFERFELGTADLVSLGLSWVQFALMVGGAIYVVRAPFAWTLAGACWWTLNAGLAGWITTLGDGVLLEDPRTIVFLVMMTFMLVAFWFAAAQARRVADLMARNPELQLERRRLDPEKRVTGGVADEARARRSREFQQRNKAGLRIVLLIAAGVLVGGGALWWASLPPAVDGAVERFTAAWQRADLDAMQAMFRRLDPRFGKGLGQRGWADAAPELGAPSIDSAPDVDDRCVVTHACAGGEVVVKWMREDDEWSIFGIELPEMSVAPLDGAIQRFRDAWAAKGTDALVAMVRPETPRRIGSAIARILEKRGWGDARPALGDTDVGRARNEGSRVKVLYACGFGEVAVTFEWWHPEWRVVGFTPPPE